MKTIIVLLATLILANCRMVSTDELKDEIRAEVAAAQEAEK